MTRLRRRLCGLLTRHRMRDWQRTAYGSVRQCWCHGNTFGTSSDIEYARRVMTKWPVTGGRDGLGGR